MDEIVPPVDEFGDYWLDEGEAYGPDQPVWSYKSEPPGDFYASFISGAQRLANDNTLICDGPAGTFFEITDARETVWKYVSPISDSGSIGTAGTFEWQDVPVQCLYFLLVGTDMTSVYESSWGRDSAGTERNDDSPSRICSATTRDSAESCP